MATIRNKQASLQKSLERCLRRSKEIKGDNAEVDEEHVKTQISHLESRYVEFCDIQDRIEAVCGVDELEGEFGSRAQHEEFYIAAMSNLKTTLRRCRTLSASPSQEDAHKVPLLSTDIQLPRIKIPTFDGDYANWIEFENLFTDLIHNSRNLTKSQKLHYLKANLIGGAATLLKSVQISEANYDEAWNILKGRYDHRRFIIDSHLRKFKNMPVLNHESASGLRKIIDTTTDTVRCLKVLAVPVTTWDIILVNIITEKLDPETHRQWELSLTRAQYPTYQELMNFLDSRWQSLEMISSLKPKSSTSQASSLRKPNTETRSLISIPDSQNSTACPICGENHNVFQCQSFKPLTFEERSDLVKKKGLCFNCLRRGHRSSECRSSSCRTCYKKHHTLLHISNKNTPKSDSSSNESSLSVQTISTHVASTLDDVLLATAIGIVTNENQDFPVRTLLDSGSQTSFISESAAHRIGLQRKPASVSINGIGASDAATSHSLVNFVLRSRVDPAWSTAITALVIDKITGTLPARTIDPQRWPHLNELQLADPHYHHPNKIDVLLGADVIGTLQTEGIIQGVSGSPIAQNTKLGHILYGKVGRTSASQLSSLTAIIENHTTVDNLLKSFWEIENVPAARTLTSDEIQCDNHFQTTHLRTPEGRYIVYLPFKDYSATLGSSRESAILRLKSMEHRCLRNPQLRLEYVKFMKDYCDSNHMEEVRPDDTSPENQICYLPHHGVLQLSRSTPKLRVVFDASHKTTTGVSLNQNLHTGPKLQQDIFSILSRFRKYKFVFIADIKQMYRQILVAAEHRNFQRIVWRNSPDEPIRDYRLRTVTYGTACGPYLAIRTLHQLAHNECKSFPIAAKVTITDFYVDDLMTGADDTDTLIETQRQMVALLKRGGFELRKWSSNNATVLEQVPEEFREPHSSLELNRDESIKALGLHWSPSTDTFCFKIALAVSTRVPTKRSILAESSRIFDPLGWLAPSVLIAKIMFQELWMLGLSWDDPVPSSISHRWSTYRQNMKQLENIKIERWLQCSSDTKNIQIHGFSDASTKAYAAVVYARVPMADGSTKISILASKTKVAPLKTVSLPRLELCGSVLLAKLMHTIVTALNLVNVQLFAWTDSQVVLGWLRSPPNRWKTFVANRVSQVLDYLEPTSWHFVESRHNPADCASRGVDPSLLGDHPLWWSGSVWLRETPDKWPRPKMEFGIPNQDKTNVKSLVVTQVKSPPKDNEMHQLLTRYSTLGKLLRITVLCRRFIQNIRLPKPQRHTSFITVPEMDWSFGFWVRLIQGVHFADEISRCQSGENLMNKSPLRSLNPFLDEAGILRVGGRLHSSNLPYRGKHPFILPKNDQLTNLIIAQAHHTTLHGGPQLMMAYLRKRYWILNLKDRVRAYVHKCVTCFRFRSITSQQLMANLPSPRVTPSRPFLHSGVDYAGPILIKLFSGRTGRSTKGYICLFVCLTTKALHLELVSDLTTNAFMAAFKRFTARRGKIQSLYSDCATNFVGSSRQLAFLHQHSAKNVNPEIAALLAEDGTTWNFIPPASPHFGGLWEAGVKSVKHHLRRIMGETLFTFEELTTLLCQIESCLNSRPLCPMSDDPDDRMALTPGHFLIGESPITTPEPSLLEMNPNHLNRYQQIQRMYQHFWRIWSNEYLSRLQQRPKWLKTKPNLVVGQLVLLKDEKCPPSKWSMGRIIETHPGSDGLVRAATVKLQETTVKRPVVKLCLLPINDNFAL